MRKLIIKANNAIASVNAKPKMAYLNNCSCSCGFLLSPKINDPKTIPIPIPVPVNPIVAIPAPINLPVCNNIFFLNSHVQTEKKGLEPLKMILKITILTN